MATIQERTGKTGAKSYRVGYYADGKFTFTPSMANRDGAERIKAIIEDKRQGPDVALRILKVNQRSTTPTLAEWFPKHLAIRSINATDGTIAGYEREAARTWLPRLGEYPLDAVTREVITEWVAWQMKQPTARSIKARDRAKAAGVKTKDLPPLETVAPKTVRNAHGLLSSVLDTAVTEGGHLGHNPAKGVPVPKDNVEEEKDIFTRDEWERFYQAMQDDYKPFVTFLLVTGARMGEAAAFRVKDLRPETGGVMILQAFKKARQGSVIGTPKSKRSRRFIKLPDWAMRELISYAHGKAPDALLFTTSQGQPIRASQFGNRQWATAIQRAGITKHLTPHSARHTFASWALMSGIAPQIVQHRMGHESLATTSTVYAHLLAEEQNTAAESIGWEPTPQIES